MEATRPNLLLVITDQQRADTVSPDHAGVTPNLQELGRGGANFGRCYSVNPICSPSRASLFTGNLPHTHGVTDVTHAVPAPQAELRPGMRLWSQELADAGYRTGYFGKWHIERSEQLERYGFQEYETELRLVGVQEKQDGQPPLERSLSLSQPGYRDLPVAGVTSASATQTREHALADRGIDFIRRAAPEQPWALVIATEAPHDPYVAPREYFDRIDPALATEPASFRDPLGGRPAIYRRIREAWQELTPEDAAFATRCYLALCRLLDDQVGRLLGALEETGQAENTLVVYTSDHGDYLGAHGLFFKGVPAFEEAYRVPLVMRGPGIREGLRPAGPVSLLDLPRTLLRLLLGAEFPCQGGDLSPLLRGEAPGGPGQAFAEFHGQRFGYTQRIVWHGDLKYVFNGFAEDELYDLAADPHELHNLAHDPAHAGDLQEMARRLWRVVRETADDTLLEAHYGMFRFAPVGPDDVQPS